MDFFIKGLNFLKSKEELSLKFVLLLFVITGLLLFLPKQFITILKLDIFIDKYGEYIGVSFLFSLGYLIISIFLFIRAKFAISKLKERLFEKLDNLTYLEKCFIREFFIQEKDVIEVPMECTEFTSLYNKGIIQYASKNIRKFIYGSYVLILLNPLVKEKITPPIIGLSNEPTQNEFEKVRSERPEFLGNLKKINDLVSGKGLY